MGRVNGKNIMRTPQEKEAIVLEYMSGGISTRAIAKKYGTTQGVFNKWLRNYRESNIEGLISQTGKKTGITKSIGQRKPRNKIEELELEILKKDIEIARLKKGYNVKGVGDEKEFVTTFNKNTK